MNKVVTLLVCFTVINSCYAMETGKSVNYNKFFDACSNKNPDEFKSLLENIEDVNLFVCNYDAESLYQGSGLYFLPASKIVTSIQDTLLGVACEQDYFEGVKYLVEEKNADVNRAGILWNDRLEAVPLQMSKSNQVRQYLFEKGADPRIKYINSELATFVNFDDFEKPLEVAQEMIKRGYSVNRRGQEGNTQMMFMGNNVAVAECFIKQRADINAQSEYGLTPLNMAIANANYNVAELLISHNASLVVSGKNREKILGCLLIATLSQFRIDFFNYIVKKEKLNINERFNGQLILNGVVASPSVDKKAILFLLSKGADPYMKDAKGNRSFDCVQDTEIKKILNNLELRRKLIFKEQFKQNNLIVSLRNRESGLNNKVLCCQPNSCLNEQKTLDF